MRYDILPEKETGTAIQAALLRQGQKKAIMYKYFYDKKKSRRNAINDLYSYWHGNSEDVVDGKVLKFKDAIFYKALMVELTKFFKLPEDKALDVYRGIDPVELEKYEIKLTEEEF